MKFNNPFESAQFWPGFCAILSIVMVFITAISLYPPLIFGVILIPFIITIRYMLKGE